MENQLLGIAQHSQRSKDEAKYSHTVSLEDTSFLTHHDGKDYYYRLSLGATHNIDIRYSDEPSDYTTWTFSSLVSAYIRDNVMMSSLIPKFILEKAVSHVQR